MQNKNKGKITLVGAGPGDPELITLKGLKAIQLADVILFDSLISTELLEHNPTAEKIYVGKRYKNPSVKQQEINEKIVAYALEGKNVVRLKGGDVMVFSRACEELEYAQLFDIETNVISGISSFLGISAQHQIPLTKRREHESFWVTIGFTAEGGISKDVKLAAQSSAMVVILMGMANLSEIIKEFLKYKPANFPIAIIENGTTPNERVVIGRLDNILDLVSQHKISNPATIFIGQSVLDPISNFKNVFSQNMINIE